MQSVEQQLQKCEKDIEDVKAKIKGVQAEVKAASGNLELSRIDSDRNICPAHSLKKMIGARLQKTLQASADTYCQASERNMAAIDSVQQPGSMFQMTASKKHSVNCAGLRSAVHSMENKLAARLYFVVPAEQYSNFKPKLIDRGGGDAELRTIEQWVLKMPY